MRAFARFAAVPVLAVLAAPSGAADKPADDGPKVRLLAPGRPPLRALRYKAAPGLTGEMAFRMELSMEMSMGGGQALPATLMPLISYVMVYRVTSVDPAGDIRYEFSFKDGKAEPRPGTLPAVVDVMRDYMEKMSRMKGHVVQTSRGVVREADFVLPEDLDPQIRQFFEGMRQSLRQLSSPFPEEAVGLGAKWETTLRATQNGVTLDQATMNELTSLDGERGRLALTVTQNAEPQQMQPPNLPAGTRIDLGTFKSSGGGESTFDLGRLLPSSAELKLHTEMGATIQVANEKQPMGMKMDMAMSMSGR